ncbi:uncharacterized protein [Triticum aestivum]|uniref:uncharacterized protein n=1 Tax=Triticum aestivum TaxID=4565 RepID=UPI001D018552|nr:uncharacterized protein LOC123102205 [Triticum aestivum]
MATAWDVVAAGWVVTVAGWLATPLITLLLPKILSYFGFDASKKLQELKIHTIPELKKTLQALDQERMMQGGKRVKTDLDALDMMAAMLRHALEDAEDIFDDAQHRVDDTSGLFGPLVARSVPPSSVLARSKKHPVRLNLSICSVYGLHPLFPFNPSVEPDPVNTSATSSDDETVSVTTGAVASGKPDLVTASAAGSDDEITHVTIGAAAFDKPDPVTVSAAVSDDEIVPVTTGVAASDKPDLVTPSATVSDDEIIPVTTSDAASDKPDLVIASVAVADDEIVPLTVCPTLSHAEIVPVSTGDVASYNLDPVTTAAEASDDEIVLVTTPSDSLSRRWLSFLCSSFDFFKNSCASLYSWLARVFEAACFYRDWSYQVVGIKKCQERSMMRAVIEDDLMRLSQEELILNETFSFTALLHSDIIYKVHSGDGSTNIAENIYENSRSKSNDSFITTRDNNTLEADLHHEMPASEGGGGESDPWDTNLFYNMNLQQQEPQDVDPSRAAANTNSSTGMNEEGER